MAGFHAIADAAIGALADEGPSRDDPLASRLLRGETPETVILARIKNRPVALAVAFSPESETLGSFAIGDAPGVGGGASAEETLLVADGLWCGRPDDFGAAHQEADVRLIDIGALQEEIPYLPEQDRRATATVANLRLANGDGRLDDFFGGRTTDGQEVELYLGEAFDGYSADWIRIADALAETLDPELDEARVELINTASLLDAPALSATYQGLGGSTGDARLAGKYVPLAFGDCFNVEPDTENLADGIDRWTVGSLNDVTALRDRGAPLLWDGNDYADYASLRAASVAPGFFTKALAIGRTKRGAAALGRITGDISAPHDTTGDILLALARGQGGIPEQLIDAPSFGVLPAAKVDLYLKGDRGVSVSEIFDALLRPFNGWYGSLGSRQIRVGLVASPAFSVEQWRVESWQIDENLLSVRRFDEPPRWRMGMTGVRNWTPMDPSDLVDVGPALSQEMSDRLQRAEETVIVENAGVKLRHRGAFDAIDRFGPIRGYFTNAADLQAQANALFQFLRRPLRRVECRTGLHEIFTRAGQTGIVALDGRLSLTDGKPALVTRRIFDGAARAVTLSTLVATDVA